MNHEPLHDALDNDDAPVGEILSRRRALALFGAAGGVLLGAGASGASTPSSASRPPPLPSCVVRPEMTEGPFFVDEKLRRSDIRPDSASKVVSAGVPLELSFVVSQVSTARCTPLSGALVDVWHCDALGRYSEVQGNTQDFLRGQQLTDPRGVARFITVYPGWYQGRAVHIHFKIRTLSGSRVVSEFSSQLFFDEKTTDLVHTQPPYAARGRRSTLNTSDGLYQRGGGQLLLAVSRKGAGYAGTFDVGMKLGS